MKKVLVIGDTILDHYVYGSVDRVNPEAPHSVVLDFEKDEYRLGGATNVANNIKSLMGDKASVHYIGAVSESISDMLTEANISCLSDETHTENQILLKTRFVCAQNHIMRLDINKKYHFDNSFYDKLLIKIMENSYDLIVISDYNKGTIKPDIVQHIFNTNLPIIFDVKTALNLPNSLQSSKNLKYLNVVLKCNKKEFNSEINTSHIHAVKAVVETRGEEGYYIHDDSSYVFKSEIFQKKNVVDVVGAGDSFLAGMAWSHLHNDKFDVKSMASCGNNIAAMKVKNFGTYAVSLKGDYDNR